jgi:metallo-beta-lactamase class B
MPRISEGHIPLNTGMPDSAPMIVAAICKLGFKPEDVKIIAVGHAHVDHVGAVAAMSSPGPRSR